MKSRRDAASDKVGRGDDTTNVLVDCGGAKASAAVLQTAQIQKNFATNFIL
jgi:hypothetical protein